MKIIWTIMMMGIIYMSFVSGMLYQEYRTPEPQVIVNTALAEYWEGKFWAKNDQIKLLHEINDSYRLSMNAAVDEAAAYRVELGEANAKLQIIKQLYDIEVVIESKQK